jgi:hypothetical protein
MRNERQHFIIPYRLDGRDRCLLLWFSDKRDGVLLTETGTVATFANQETLQHSHRSEACPSNWIRAATGTST